MLPTIKLSYETQTNSPRQNWSGLQQFTPQETHFPSDTAQLSSLMKKANQLRVVGAGHSFSPIVNTDDTLVSLDLLSGVEAVDELACNSRIFAGTKLKDLGPKLHAHGLGLINQGDIDAQSLAGAIQTGTHGTGIGLSCLAACVEAFEMLDAQGDTVVCSATQNPDIFSAGRVALGMLGVMTSVTFRSRPSYKLHEKSYVEKTSSLLVKIEALRDSHRHVECFSMIHGGWSIVKIMDETTADVRMPKPELLSDDLMLTVLSELARFAPAVNAMIQPKLSSLIGSTDKIGWSHEVFPSVRGTRFNEMEYHVPASQGVACLEEVLATLKRHKVPVFFPVEFRYVKQDDCWISPFYQRDSASIAVHQYYKQDHQAIFQLVEPVLKRYGGRPHWGKLHNITRDEVAAMYPKWEAFSKLRQELDPRGKFLNSFLSQYFAA